MDLPAGRLAALYFIRRFILAWQELRESAFAWNAKAPGALEPGTIVLVFFAGNGYQ